MPTEIERKFLVTGDSWKERVVAQTPMRQGYFETGPMSTVRVRIEGERAVLTIKGPTVGISRAEYEYEIPMEDARQMLDIFCTDRQVEKVRYDVEFGGKLWEVDVFEGANAGLVTAEVELERPDEEVELPAWIGDDVSKESRYRNACLARQPWTTWAPESRNP
ncbi:CYTH domain-containing protein [Persicimonas caeni]|uniref:CYTH domain-containing protein n=1 Tax=Persicimonas caeni TaxID=2292766 RepID=A0A4Y6PY21_PERCE|nr:CYTH domain-containing protein [Persicimonas caeni]QDG53221.1 CYTH domain-containing protein [Persicimonas caeni]QED34443.1 CYTH domain-containing protein [Persicimonas caeni]